MESLLPRECTTKIVLNSSQVSPLPLIGSVEVGWQLNNKKSHDGVRVFGHGMCSSKMVWTNTTRTIETKNAAVPLELVGARLLGAFVTGAWDVPVQYSIPIPQ